MSIVVDTSAFVAIILGEPDAEIFASILASNAGDVMTSAATWVETNIVIGAKPGPEGVDDLGRLAAAGSLEIVPLDAAQVDLAVAAWWRFGKGRHTAALNLGDCYAYALARHTGAALLFEGDDFSQTDIADARS